MQLAHRNRSLALLTGLLAACSGSGGDGSGPSVTLAVTDLASESLSNFSIEIDSVLLQGTGAPVTLLQDEVGIDFSSLADLSRVLNATSIPADVYTAVEVTFDFDGAKVVLHDQTTDAALLDADGNPLLGTITLPITFETPLVVTTGNHVLELDLDLNQSVDVDFGTNSAFVEVSALARVNRSDPKEFAIGGILQSINLVKHIFVVDLDAATSDPIMIGMDATTVFQIDGQCLTGLVGLSALANLPNNSWVQAFGSVDASTVTFSAQTVEAGTGSYNGGSDIIEGHIIGRVGAPGIPPVLTVRGRSNFADHTSFQFNVNFTVNTSLDTKVVRRDSGDPFDTDDLNVGQSVRVFGVLDDVSKIMDATAATDVVRLQPTRVFGLAASAPASGLMTINLSRVDLRGQGEFTWSEGGTTPPDPVAMTLSVGQLGVGQAITAGSPVEAVGFFSPVGDAGDDFTASRLLNRVGGPSLLIIRDRGTGLATDTTVSGSQILFTFGTGTGRERAVVDQGFVGEVDVEPTGVTIEANTLNIGLYTIRDRTLNTVKLYIDFDTFATALETELGSGATLFNLGSIGQYTSGTHTIASALTGVVLN